MFSKVHVTRSPATRLPTVAVMLVVDAPETVDVPKALVESEAQRLMQQTLHDMESRGMKMNVARKDLDNIIKVLPAEKSPAAALRKRVPLPLFQVPLLPRLWTRSAQQPPASALAKLRPSTSRLEAARARQRKALWAAGPCQAASP